MKYLLTILLLYTGSFAGKAQQVSLQTLDFFIGEWELTTIDITPQGTFTKGKARSRCYYILDKKAIQDDFYGLNPKGKKAFWGTSIRSFHRKSSKFQIVWLMPGHKGLTDIEAKWENRKLVATGKGYDGYGQFLERFEYYDINPKSYKFKMDRSYDGGKTWIKNFGRIEAKKVK